MVELSPRPHPGGQHRQEEEHDPESVGDSPHFVVEHSTFLPRTGQTMLKRSERMRRWGIPSSFRVDSAMFIKGSGPHMK